MIGRLLKARIVGLCCILSILASSILISCSSGVGQQWCATNATTSFNLKNLYLSAVSMTSPDEGWATGSGTILHYSNHQWASLTGQGIPGLASVYMQSSNLGLAGADKAEILRYKDGCWKEEVGKPLSTNGYYQSIFAITALSDNSAWAIGWDSTIKRYSNGTWVDESSLANAGGGASLNSIYMLSEENGWIVGSDINGGSVILQYQNGRWVRQASTPSTPLNSVMFLSENEGWAVGNEYKNYGHDGVIFHYSDGTWSEVSIPTIENLHGVSMQSAADGWAVGVDHKNKGAILHLVNGSWQQVVIPKVGELFSVAMVSANEGWAIGNGTILHYQNGTWQQWQQ